MKEKIIIIDRNTGALEFYKKQLDDIFENKLDINTLLVEDIKDNVIKGDYFLFPSYSIFYEINDKQLKGKKLFIGRTILTDSFNKVCKIAEGKAVYIVDDNKQMAAEIIYILRRMLHVKIDLKPIGIKDMKKDSKGFFVSIGFDLSKYGVEYMNIGNTVISIGSIIELAMEFNLINILSQKDISLASGELINYEKGYEFLRKEANKLKGIMDNFFSFFEDGYFIFNKEGNMTFYNDVGIKMLKINPKNIVNIKELLSEKKISEIFEKNETVIDEIITVNNKSLVISIYPNINSGEFFGVTAILKEYEKSENRQLEIRKKISGSSSHVAKYTFEDIIGKSSVILKTIENAKRMSKSDSSILIEGETGTGKELFAQAIHQYSDRAQYPFVAVNFGALPINILESELFGYEEGAFTGAKSGGRPGLFEIAHKGTIFLDEIGEMPLEVQTKLLRVLQEKEVIRLGSDKVIVVDIRVIAATNKNLYEMVQNKTFREDLYYRLKVLPIKVDALRDRKEDIELLLKHFKKMYKGEYDFSEDALEVLRNHNWRGNIRELRNYVEFFNNTGKTVIEKKDLPIESMNMTNQTIAGDYEDNALVDELIEIAGIEKNKYLTVLEVLKEKYETQSRVGRIGISKEAEAKGEVISEQEVRRILNDLEKIGLVKKNKGRKGSEITIKGIETINQSIGGNRY